MPHSVVPKNQGLAARSSGSFVTGVLAGAAISTLVPWETFQVMAPKLRLAAVAALCAAFVLLRLAFCGSEVRKFTAVVMVSVGGLLMSAGSKVLPGALAISPVAVGATLFLFGVTLLMRERRLPSHLREAAVGRLLEDPIRPAGGHDGIGDIDATPSIERLRALEALTETDPRSTSGAMKVY